MKKGSRRFLAKQKAAEAAASCDTSELAASSPMVATHSDEGVIEPFSMGTASSVSGGTADGTSSEPEVTYMPLTLPQVNGYIAAANAQLAADLQMAHQKVLSLQEAADHHDEELRSQAVQLQSELNDETEIALQLSDQVSLLASELWSQKLEVDEMDASKALQLEAAHAEQQESSTRMELEFAEQSKTCKRLTIRHNLAESEPRAYMNKDKVECSLYADEKNMFKALQDQATLQQEVHMQEMKMAKQCQQHLEGRLVVETNAVHLFGRAAQENAEAYEALKAKLADLSR